MKTSVNTWITIFIVFMIVLVIVMLISGSWETNAEKFASDYTKQKCRYITRTFGTWYEYMVECQGKDQNMLYGCISDKICREIQP